MWGGYSSYNEDFINNEKQLTGADCSGILGMSFRIHNINLPRDSHDQFVKSRNITFPNFRKGDFFFYESVRRNRVTHIIMYLGNELFIESGSSNNSKRIVNSIDLFGFPTKSQLINELQRNP